MNIFKNPRAGNFAGFFACVGMMACALYFQYGMGLEPCPLCVFQRVGTIALGLAFLLAAIHNPAGWGRGVYVMFVPIVGLAGAAVSARHVWLQNLPKDQVPACGPDLNFMFDTFPFLEVLSTVLSGSGECAKIAWQFLGLSMPAWVMILLGGLSAWALWVNVPGRRV
jgi:disulfide bond formation protein DsbB